MIVLLPPGTELFTTVATLRTRLGRENGVGLVLLELNPELLTLPARVGDIDRFWSNWSSKDRA